jgi:exopolyphosphatase/guanosine-5'-triphosphate,3'-diphosphate pyrophosphatase
MATEIIGISEAERFIIANIVKYNHQDFDYFDQFVGENEMDRISYLIVAKLTAILRVANGLDLSNKHKVHSVKAATKNGELVLTIDTDKDIALERGLFEYSSRFFEEVFSLRPVIRRKRAF